jgi:restriction system protein
MDIIYHYPPELLSLLIDTIPLLFRSKRDVITFFKGAGVPPAITEDLARQITVDKESISKYEIVRTVLTRLNERGERSLRERREVLKRVIEFENFSSCWPSDQLKGKGLVNEVRSIVNVKDSFTRMQQERDAERRQRIEDQDATRKARTQKREALHSIKASLFALFSETNPQRRGKALEGVLNSLFKEAGILVREAFTLVGSDGEGVVEQIDGVIEQGGHTYLVEMKWWQEPLGTAEVSQHLVRVMFRGQSRGIFISTSGYTEPAIAICREALQKSVFVLCHLQELVLLLEGEHDLKDFLKKKIDAAVIHKNPMFEPLTNA